MTINIKGYDVQIDDEDWDKVKGYNWYIDFTKRNVPYVKHTIHFKGDRNHKSQIRMHRLIMGCATGDGSVVDHINGNTLDNRKSNLRICTVEENNMNQNIYKNNTSGYKGVTWNKKRNVWVVYLAVNKKNKYLGDYHDPVEAAIVYDINALKYRGEFARTNFPRDNYIKEQQDD